MWYVQCLTKVVLWGIVKIYHSQSHHKDLSHGHMTCQNLNNFSDRLKCKEREKHNYYTLLLFVCAMLCMYMYVYMNEKIDRSCDRVMPLCDRFNKVRGWFNNSHFVLLRKVGLHNISYKRTLVTLGIKGPW